MHRALLLLAAAAAVTSCAGASDRRASPPPVSYRFAGDDISAANARADSYCRQFGKRARLSDVKSDGAGNVARYRCR